MDLELAQFAAGLPMALSLALAGGISSFREGRRRSALNEAMHELRRPLQALSLAGPADPARARSFEASLRLAVVALEQLDREINGAGEAGNCEPLVIGSLVETAAERWEARARGVGRVMRICDQASGVIVQGDPVQLAQAVDNLISNAIEHGSGEIAVEVRRIGKRVRIAILDQGPKEGRGAPHRPGLRARCEGRCRHGHGLRVVGRAARLHGGAFQLHRSATGTEAWLELPLARSGAGA